MNKEEIQQIKGGCILFVLMTLLIVLMFLGGPYFNSPTDEEIAVEKFQLLRRRYVCGLNESGKKYAGKIEKTEIYKDKNATYFALVCENEVFFIHRKNRLDNNDEIRIWERMSWEYMKRHPEEDEIPVNLTIKG